jgi:predicted RNA-binding protein with RPS1 domain
MTKYKEGKIINGTVTGIESYGIFVSCDEFYSGLIHISEISHGFVKNPGDFVKVGDIINVKIIGVDDELGQLKLSIKNIDYKMSTKSRRKKIVETGKGFTLLYEKLPFWIQENIKKT